MIRTFNYTLNEEQKIINKAYSLLKKHNNALSLKKKRLLTEDDESFISGCKGNLSYGDQKHLSNKQLRKLETTISRYS